MPKLSQGQKEIILIAVNVMLLVVLLIGAFWGIGVLGGLLVQAFEEVTPGITSARCG